MTQFLSCFPSAISRRNYSPAMSSVGNAWSTPVKGPPIPGRDCYSVLRPVTCFYRVAGVFPLSLRGAVGQRKYSTSYALLIYSAAIHVVILTDLFMWTGNSIGRAERSRNKILVQTSNKAELVIQILSTVVIFASVMLGREKFAKVINSLCALDEGLRKIGNRFDYAAEFQRSCIRLGIMISTIIFLSATDFCYELEFNSRNPMNWIAWYCSNILRIISTCFFADMILLLTQRFRAVNKSLRKIIRELRDSPVKIMSTRLKICTRIRSIAMIHGDLCKSATSLNRIFGVNVVVAVIFALIILTTAMYHMVQEIESPQRSYGRLCGYINWGLISSIHIIYVVTVCNMTRNQACLTGKLMNKLNAEDFNSALNSAIKSFLLQLHHENIKFSGAGLFPLDATLIQSIAGAVTTYLVIMMQFDTAKS